MSKQPDGLTKVTHYTWEELEARMEENRIHCQEQSRQAQKRYRETIEAIDEMVKLEREIARAISR